MSLYIFPNKLPILVFFISAGSVSLGSGDRGPYNTVQALLDKIMVINSTVIARLPMFNSYNELTHFYENLCAIMRSFSPQRTFGVTHISYFHQLECFCKKIRVDFKEF